MCPRDRLSAPKPAAESTARRVTWRARQAGQLGQSQSDSHSTSAEQEEVLMVSPAEWYTLPPAT